MRVERPVPGVIRLENSKRRSFVIVLIIIITTLVWEMLLQQSAWKSQVDSPFYILSALPVVLVPILLRHLVYLFHGRVLVFDSAEFVRLGWSTIGTVVAVELKTEDTDGMLQKIRYGEQRTIHVQLIEFEDAVGGV